LFRIGVLRKREIVAGPTAADRLVRSLREARKPGRYGRRRSGGSLKNFLAVFRKSQKRITKNGPFVPIRGCRTIASLKATLNETLNDL
jgi:hypothetical protein